MHKKWKQLWVIPLLIAIIISFVGCGGNTSDENRIVGTWEYDSKGWAASDQIVTFNKSGSFYDPNCYMVNATSGTWEIISEGKLHLDWGSNDDILDYEFQGKKLIIDGEEYTKK